MDLFSELRTAGISWSLQPGFAQVGLGSKHKRPTVELKVIFPEGEPVGRHFLDTNAAALSTTQMVVATLKSDARAAAVMKKWFESQGNVPVKLVDSVLQYRSFPEAVHTGLRKLADSAQSCITWNAIHQLHPQDGNEFWAAVEASILKSIFEPHDNRPPTRRQVAKSLRDDITTHLRGRHNRELNIEGRRVQRTAEQRYTVLSFSAACELTDIDEWMYGWLGYVIEEVADEASAGAA